MSQVPIPFCSPLAGNIFLVEWMQVREARGSERQGVGLNSGIGCCFSQWPQQQEKGPGLVLAQRHHLPSRCVGTYRPMSLSSIFWGPAWTKTSHRWAEVNCNLCGCPVSSLILSLGCCSLKAPEPWRKGRP